MPFSSAPRHDATRGPEQPEGSAGSVARGRGPDGPQKAVADLHRRFGNRHVQRMIQTALDVGPVDDPLEREADRIAERVTGTSLRRAPASARGVPTASGGVADPAVTGAVGRSRGGGRPVPEGIRRRMEGVSGADLSGVRVHVGSESDRLNVSLGARAFTVGSDVFVRRAEFRPGTAMRRCALGT